MVMKFTQGCRFPLQPWAEISERLRRYRPQSIQYASFRPEQGWMEF